jgi:hypothetical protein
MSLNDHFALAWQLSFGISHEMKALSNGHLETLVDVFRPAR